MTLTPTRDVTDMYKALSELMLDNTALDRHIQANLQPDVIADIKNKIEAAGVEYIYYMLPTLGSRNIAKMVPANHFARNFQKGIAFHRTALADLQTSRLGHLIGGGIEAKEFVGIPEPETFTVLPWDTKVARIFCTAYEPTHLPTVGGRPLALDSRHLLRIMHAAFKQVHGLEARSGTEPEMTWEGEGLDVKTRPGGSPAYQVDNLERMRPIYQRLVTYAKAMGLDMIEGDYEDGGQLELNWMYDNVELTADRLVTYRQICKQVAREFGVTASFMPKPAIGTMGNGCHHNLSLWDGDTNVLLDKGVDELHMSEIGRHAIGGILKHASGAMLIMASTVNSYKRFWDIGQFAPSTIDWGLDSRAALIRISANGRMEFRVPDAMVNPYLSHAVLLAAMSEGILKQIDPGNPAGDGRPTLDHGILPRTLGEAIQAFKDDKLVHDAMPEKMKDVLIELKEDEWARYCGAVTDWDHDMYWESIP
ncbi:glutamine synthetase family protein [Arthrobacter sp. MDB2-24]